MSLQVLPSGRICPCCMKDTSFHKVGCDLERLQLSKGLSEGEAIMEWGLTVIRNAETPKRS
jgi:hypothetical protein